MLNWNSQQISTSNCKSNNNDTCFALSGFFMWPTNALSNKRLLSTMQKKPFHFLFPKRNIIIETVKCQSWLEKCGRTVDPFLHKTILKTIFLCLGFRKIEKDKKKISFRFLLRDFETLKDSAKTSYWISLVTSCNWLSEILTIK